jgi:hypothetical protein
MTETLDVVPPDDSSDPLALVVSVVEEADDNVLEALARIESARAGFGRFENHPDYATGIAFLDAAQNFYASLGRLQSADFATSLELITHAHEGFEAIGHEELAQTSEGLRLYMTGIVNLQAFNLGSANQQLKEAQQYLDKAGSFGLRFRPMIDHIAPEQLFVAGVAAAVRQDAASAKALIEDAGQKAEYVARTYYEPDNPSQSFFMGLAQLYRAHFWLFESSSNLRLFKLDPLPPTNEGAIAAGQARDLFGTADLDNPIRMKCFRLSGVLGALFDVLGPVSRVVAGLLSQGLLPDVDYELLVRRVKEAANDAAQLGEQGAVVIHQCEQMLVTLQNVRRFHMARPAPPVAAEIPGYSPVRLFVMMPFNEACADLEKALREVFEDDPYWFQIILARDRTVKRNLFDNVKAHMRLVNGFFADITDQNPNVMLELGMTENDPLNRPVFILRGKHGPEPPSDLKGRLYVEYTRRQGEDPERVVAALVHDLREQFDAIDDLQQLRRARQQRFLSSSYITRQLQGARLDMKPDEIERLQNAYSTVENLMESDARTIAAKTGLDAKLAALIARAFKSKGKKPSHA